MGFGAFGVVNGQAGMLQRAAQCGNVFLFCGLFQNNNHGTFLSSCRRESGSALLFFGYKIKNAPTDGQNRLPERCQQEFYAFPAAKARQRRPFLIKKK